MIYISNTVASAPDDRDYPYTPKATYPEVTSLRDYIFEIEDQGRIGSCTANATVSACELIASRAGKAVDLSRLFNYWQSREADQMLGQEGATLRSAVKQAAKKGLPLETTWPYNENAANVKPSDAAYTEALQRPITRYERIMLNPDSWQGNIAAIKSAVSEGFPVVFAARITSQWMDLRGKNQNYLGTGYGPGSFPVVGNHAMVIVGYDKNTFHVQNSWGNNWGDNGMGYMGTTLERDIYEAWAVIGFAGNSPAPAVVYKTDPLEVIRWYHSIGRIDVTDVNDPNVQYWATTTADSDVFYGTVIAICQKLMKVRR